MSSVMKTEEGFTRIPATIKFTRPLAGTVPQGAETYLNHLRRKTGITDEMELRRIFIKNVQAEKGLEENGVPLHPEDLTETEWQRFVDQAAEIYSSAQLSGFLRDPEYGLYIGSYQVKGALKEATNNLFPYEKGKRKWLGTTPQNIIKDMVEIEEERLYLHRHGVDGVRETPGHVMTPQGERQAISRNEYVENARIDFTVVLPDRIAETCLKPWTWQQLWTKIEYSGIGAIRKYGLGRLEVVRWGDVMEDGYVERDPLPAALAPLDRV